ncbi:MAG: phosphoenolpyruvate carboxykinase (GTP) [Bacteroidales bacterium]|nr:phosphoenolpyruvate carboxykinase (GTP) [Bacteroidales bacterium]
MNIDRSILSQDNLKKLEYLNNPKVMRIVEEFTNVLKPAKVSVITDAQKDIDYVRELALKTGEEKKLSMKGHTIHYDSYYDQARDKENTCVLVTPEMKMSKVINTKPKEEGVKEVLEIMDGAMKGKEALVRFFSLGPLDSVFSICALQITDSSYVGHSEDILYRSGYEEFKKLNGSENFFYFIHSAGELDERGNTKNIDKRRIYMDLKEDRVLTVNNQYAGNSLGLKKLALRLAVYRANNEDWLTEHMFIMGIKPEGKNRISYFTGAFPSACGKTSTAMVPGQTIVGDDIAYLREWDDGICHAINIEQGIFGIITDVNPKDDPFIYEVLTTPRELIFSNILINNGKPYWLNMGKELPNEGMNHYSDNWKLGDKDKDGKIVEHAHKNARYTVRINELSNADPNLNDPEGVPISGVIYGGRDSDTSVPVFQSLSWEHGVYIGATIESETTAATLGKVGVRKFSPMANLDFLVVQLGKYINNHIKFGNKLKKPPLVFATNYFILDENGNFLSEKVDKKVWLIWMEGRVHGEYDAIESPIGYIPKYEDLQPLFKQIFYREYTKELYEKQFSIRVQKFLEKIARMEKIYNAEEDIPQAFTNIMKDQKERLLAFKQKYGKDIVSPFEIS